MQSRYTLSKERIKICQGIFWLNTLQNEYDNEGEKVEDVVFICQRVSVLSNKSELTQTIEYLETELSDFNFWDIIRKER